MKGSALGVLLDNGTGATKNQPVQELYNATTFTGVDVVNTATGYKAWFSSSESISGTGTALQSLQISYVNGAGLGSPSSCPTGFISVPGNTEFNQPGFCVAKYEMSYNDADAPDSGTSAGTKDGTDVALDWNTMNYNSAKIPVSMPNKYPIVNINQLHAITACQSMGAGYHLVTNNEWMTVARNIEQQGDNWSTGIVGSGGLYRGITGEANSTTSLGCDTPSSAGAGSRAYVAKPLSTDTTKFGASKTNDCDSKRQLKLSNNQIVWDIAGNVWSHVNKANSIDGSNYNLGQTSVAGCTVTNDWNEWTAGCTDKTNTSKNTSLSSVNGIGQVYYSA